MVRSVPVRTRIAQIVSALYGRSITPFSSKTEETASGARGSYKACQVFGNVCFTEKLQDARDLPIVEIKPAVVLCQKS